MTLGDISLGSADWVATLPLRHAVLRPGQPERSAHFEFDDHARSYHVIARDHGELVGVGSILPEGRDGALSQDTCRIRGMAVLPDRRGEGIGRLILEALVRSALAAPDIDTVWCNARVAARSLYERFGFQIIGEPFDLADIGPHVLLVAKAGSLRGLIHAE